uniref:Aromatic amino acid beta-eliminating lyase/threonine aldolase domain-containing protein n=1 Tax=Nelumbo nucifera TaxID=4432 RepID=A0A822Z6L6_NELNU|nr:TPA_asm: hypothetical protein HUJ06_014593 [Nelumbo nucifera]
MLHLLFRLRGSGKTLGGGMRQIDILCAAAYVALHENVGKLEGDHKKAKSLAEGLNQIKELRVDVSSVETNIAVNVNHHKVGEADEPAMYKINDDLVTATHLIL